MTAPLREELNLPFSTSWPRRGDRTRLPACLSDLISLFLSCSVFHLVFHLDTPQSLRFLHLHFHTWASLLFIQPHFKMSDDDCRSPIGLDCCSCCLDLANGCDDSLSSSPAQGLGTNGGLPASPTSPSVSHFRQLRNQLMYQNLNTDKLNNIMRQDSLDSVVRDPCFLLNEGICNSNIDQTMLSILLFFHRYVCRLAYLITYTLI